MSDYIAVATLFNGKQVVVEPNFTQEKCHYRYVSTDEVKNKTFVQNKKYIWLETPIHSTLEKGERIIFSTIEGTPVVFNRIKE